MKTNGTDKRHNPRAKPPPETTRKFQTATATTATATKTDTPERRREKRKNQMKKTTTTTAQKSPSALDQIDTILADKTLCPTDRRTLKDRGECDIITNQSEATGILANAGLITPETIPHIRQTGKLATMDKFLATWLYGKTEKPKAIPKAELAAENARLLAELARLKAGKAKA